MVQISKHKINAKVETKIFKLLFDVIGKHENFEHFNIIFNGIFSPVEKLVIAKRIAIIFLLVKRIEWKVICEILKVSLSSVSKCQMILLNSSEVESTFTVLMKKRENGIAIEEFFLAFFGPGTAYTNWKNAWKRKYELEQRKTEIL